MTPRFITRSHLVLKICLAALGVLVLTGAFARNLHAYALEGPRWPSNSNPVAQLELGSAGRTLSDGNTSWNSAVSPAIDMWNQVMSNLQLGRVNSSAPIVSGDGLNSLSFGSSFFGQSFGANTLAVTYYSYSGSRMIEGDIVFNTAWTWDSYRGGLRSNPDIQRVALHELGHLLGLAHSSVTNAIMYAYINNSYLLTADDIAGIQSLYGTPSGGPTPTPTPSPSATPTPTPSATPTPTPSVTPTPTPSTVSVSLVVAPRTVRTGGTATFTISASTPASGPVTVSYRMSGNAIQGTTYSLDGTPGQVTIQSGASSATVTLTNLGVGRRGKTATMTLNPGSGYNLSPPTSASVSLTR